MLGWPATTTGLGVKVSRILSVLLLFGSAWATPSRAETAERIAEAGRRLVAAYPEYLAASDGTLLVWKDGTRMPLDDGAGEKAHAAWLEQPDVEDMLAQRYPAGSDAQPPGGDVDPGRARNKAFFDKMYGDCQAGEAAANLAPVAWLARRGGKPLRVTRINGVAEKVAAISAELDKLPRSFDRYLVPAAGGFVCRTIAGTERTSAHGYGIAVDIATRHAHYWRWAKGGASGKPQWRNAIPMEIVRIFEKHGFIWGGRWYHYDTMHFEYRPELIETVGSKGTGE